MNTLVIPRRDTSMFAPGRGRHLQPPDIGQRGTGLAVVLVVHLAAGALLASGLARDAVNFVSKPLQMNIIPEQAPPPPAPPPKVERKIERPKVETPPPAYVPLPEVVVAAAPPPVIVAVQREVPQAPVVVAPSPPPPEPRPVAVVRKEIGLACPGYQAVLTQVLADAFDRVGIVGAVRTRFSVRGRQVVDAVPLSGPKEYYKFVQAAIQRMKCSAEGADEIQVTLDVSFTS
jgi:protein TonB